MLPALIENLENIAQKLARIVLAVGRLFVRIFAVHISPSQQYGILPTRIPQTEHLDDTRDQASQIHNHGKPTRISKADVTRLEIVQLYKVIVRTYGSFTLLNIDSS